MAFDDDIIWNEPEENKKKKNSQTGFQSDGTLSDKEYLSSSDSLSEKPKILEEEQYSYSQLHQGDFYNWGLKFALFGLLACLLFALDLPSLRFHNIIFRAYRSFEGFTPLAIMQKNVGKEAPKEVKPQYGENILEEEISRKILYKKNFSTVSNAISLLEADGRCCSFTALGLANCFATELNVSKQSGNVLYLEDGAVYTFDCKNQKCTLDIDVNVEGAEIMSIPLNMDDDGNVSIDRKDVEKFIN